MTGPSWRDLAANMTVSDEMINPAGPNLYGKLSQLGGFVNVSQEAWDMANPSLRYRAFGGYGPWLIVKADPLGPVNKIITVNRVDGTRVRSMLYPVPTGAKVTLETVCDTNPFGFSYGPSWAVKIDDTMIMRVPSHELLPDLVPVPKVPLKTQLRRKLGAVVERAADRVAARYGYHHRDDCDDY